jgi:uncharacterized membrane protein YbhN (UPF0104 family)
MADHIAPCLGNSLSSYRRRPPGRVWIEHNHAGQARRAFRAEYLKKSFGLSRAWALTSIVIERLFDGLTVVTCLGLGLLLAAAGREGAGILLDVVATGGILFGAILLAALWLSGSTVPRAISRFPRLSARLEMVQKGFGILRTWRILEIAILTLIIYLPDALSLWFLVKAVGLTLGFGDTLVLVGMASLSTLVPSGPAFLGTLQFAYMLAIGFAGGPHAVGIAAATLSEAEEPRPEANEAAGQ